MPKPDHPLEPHRRPDVYAPGEPLPEPGKREPFFGPGLSPLILKIAVLIFLVWIGFFDLIRWAVDALFKAFR